MDIKFIIWLTTMVYICFCGRATYLVWAIKMPIQDSLIRSGKECPKAFGLVLIASIPLVILIKLAEFM